MTGHLAPQHHRLPADRMVKLCCPRGDFLSRADDLDQRNEMRRIEGMRRDVAIGMAAIGDQTAAQERGRAARHDDIRWQEIVDPGQQFALQRFFLRRIFLNKLGAFQRRRQIGGERQTARPERPSCASCGKAFSI
jgi:hypothetical protein